MDPILDVWGRDGQRRRIPLRNPRFDIGRLPDNDLAFPEDVSLSRHHVQLEFAELGWTVRDLSKNGTILNGSRLRKGEPVPLHPGDRIEAGGLRMEFNFAPTGPKVEFIDETEHRDDTSTTILTRLDEILKERGEVNSGALGSAGEGAARRIGALIEAGRELAGHRPLSELFPVILNLALKSVGATRGAILSIEKGGLITRCITGGALRVSNTIKDRVLRDRSSLLIRDTGKDATLMGVESLVAQNVRSLMAVPLQTSDRVIGMIYVDCPDRIRNFTTEDLNLLTVMANTAAVCIEQTRRAEIERNEEMIRRELEQAAVIQRNLFPETAPEIEGWEIAGSSDPCQAVGGDYYDYVATPDGGFAVLVADVAGKGLPGALLMFSLEARFVTLAEEVIGAGELMTRLNHGIKPKCPSNRFITAFIAILHPGSEEVEYSNAGHNPPLLYRAGGPSEFLTDGGPVLGVLGGVSYASGRVRLGPGDTLVLYTDGITEAPNLQFQEFGEDRLMAHCGKLPSMSALEFIRDLRAAVWEFAAGAAQADDVTAVVVRRL